MLALTLLRSSRQGIQYALQTPAGILDDGPDVRIDDDGEHRLSSRAHDLGVSSGTDPPRLRCDLARTRQADTLPPDCRSCACDDVVALIDSCEVFPHVPTQCSNLRAWPPPIRRTLSLSRVALERRLREHGVMRRHLLAIAFVVVAGCGNSSTSGSGTDADVLVNGDGVVCMADGNACGPLDICCSGRCQGSVCLPPGTCLAPGAACTAGATNDCCSSRCEPVQGMTGVTQCAKVCSGNGAACDKAIDCCDLNCNNGTCGGAICAVQSDPCTTNSQCCSNICNMGTCELDPANTECRGTGETCNAGPQNGCCSMVCDKGADPKRCGFGADTCKAQNASCTTDAQCCSGTCDLVTGLCVTQCMPTAGACMTPADCCSSICTNGACQPPVNCTPVAGMCTINEDCCSGLCLGGFCDLLQ